MIIVYMRQASILHSAPSKNMNQLSLNIPVAPAIEGLHRGVVGACQGSCRLR